jgi:hypothetical protein
VINVISAINCRIESDSDDQKTKSKVLLRGIDESETHQSYCGYDQTCNSLVSVFVLSCTTIVSTDTVEDFPHVSYRKVVPDDKKVCQRTEEEAQDPQDEVGQG